MYNKRCVGSFSPLGTVLVLGISPSLTKHNFAWLAFTLWVVLAGTFVGLIEIAIPCMHLSELNQIPWNLQEDAWIWTFSLDVVVWIEFLQHMNN